MGGGEEEGKREVGNKGEREGSGEGGKEEIV